MLNGSRMILEFYQKIVGIVVRCWPSIVHRRQSIVNCRRWTVDGGLPTKIVSALLIFIFTLTGCNHERTLSEPPPQLLGKQQMVSFLIDLHLAEAKMNYIEMRKTDSLEIIFRNYEKYLMNQHGLTDSVYLKSYEYYLDHMELMDEIYNDVVDSLSVMNSRQKAKEFEETDNES